METNFSNNEGFSGFIQSTTKFSASIATFVTGVDAFNSGNVNFVSTLKTWGKTFSLTSLIAATEKIAGRYLDARVDLTKSLSLVGTKKDKMMDLIQSERESLLLYGVTIKDTSEIMKGLVREFGTIDLATKEDGLIKSTALMAKGFHTTNEAMAEVVGKFSVLNGMDKLGIEGAMGSLAATADAANVSSAAVFDNLKSASNMMYLFNMKGDDAEKKWAKMGTTMTAMGVNMGSAIDASQEFRNVGSAVSKSAELSALGIQLGPTALMQQAYDPTNIDKNMFNVFGQMEGKTEAEKFAISQSASGAFGMSRDEFMSAFSKAQNFDQFDAVIAGNADAIKAWEEQTEEAKHFSERLDSLIEVVVKDLIDPFMAPLVETLQSIFGALTSGPGIIALQGIAGIVGGMFLLQKAKQGVDAIGGLIGGGGPAGMRNMLANGRVGSSVIRGLGSKNKFVRGISGFGSKLLGGGSGMAGGGGMPGGGMPGGGMPGAGGPGGAGGMFQNMSGSGLIKGAAAMVIMAGAMFLMAKALKQFEGLDWKTLGMAGATLVGMTAAFVAIGMVMSSGVGTVAILAGAAAIVILGVAMIPAAYAMKIFGDAAIKMSAAVKPLLEIITGGLLSAFTVLSDTVVRVFQIISDSIQPFGNMVGNMVTKVGMAIQPLLEMFTGVFLTGFQTLSNTIITVVQTMTGAIEPFGNMVTKIFGAISEGFNSTILTMTDSIKGLASGEFDYMGAAKGIAAMGLAVGTFGTVTAGAGLAKGAADKISGLFGMDENAFNPIEGLGKVAKQYVTPLQQTGVAIQNIADGMERISKVNELGNLAIDSNVNSSSGRMLEANIRIDMNGTKLAEQLEHIWAGDKK